MRLRGVRYWWATLSMLLVLVWYVAPMVNAIRQASGVNVVTPLPALSFPGVGFPLLRAPKVHRLAPLPPLPAAPKSSTGTTVPTRPTKTVRNRIPVVSDTHTQVAPTASSASPSGQSATDPFASAPVVGDDIGAPVLAPTTTAPTLPVATSPSATTPSDAAPSATPPASDPAAATPSADYAAAQPTTHVQMSPGSGDSSTDPSTEPEPLRVAHDTAAAAAPTTSDATATDATAAAPNTTPDTGAADEGSSTDTSAPEASDAADAATATGTDATLDTSAAAGPAEPDTGAAPTDAAAADTSDTTTGTTDASAAPAAAVDPTSGPADPAPAPEAWAVDLADGSAHTVSIASDGTNLLVTVDGVTDSRPLESVSSVAVTGGDGGDDVTVDSSIAATGIPVSVDGREGSDTYRVGGDFDKLSLTADSTDTLDLAGASDTIGHPDDATFTSSSGGTLTVS
ncbi:MAG TPA: hypothetical protein VFK17_10185, partial [Gaiellaceae bacterium]|nr:hypothetical protein [Gaiellaceae bacterium]